MQNIRVFHVEDYKFLRDGLRLLLSNHPTITLVGQVAHADNLPYILSSDPVDVLVLDLYYDSFEEITVKNGIELCPLLMSQFPSLKIIAHSAFDNTHIVDTVFKAGAAAYVSKRSGIEELLAAIDAVANGKRFVCETTARKIKNLSGFMNGLEGRLKGRDEIFSVREKEVLPLLGRGRSSREIAQLLSVTIRTVETHRKNMMRKAEAKNTAELIVFAASAGLLK